MRAADEILRRRKFKAVMLRPKKNLLARPLRLKNEKYEEALYLHAVVDDAARWLQCQLCLPENDGTDSAQAATDANEQARPDSDADAENGTDQHCDDQRATGAGDAFAAGWSRAFRRHGLSHRSAIHSRPALPARRSRRDLHAD